MSDPDSWVPGSWASAPDVSLVMTEAAESE